MIRSSTSTLVFVGSLATLINACAEAGAGNPPPGHRSFALDANCGGSAPTGGTVGAAGTSEEFSGAGGSGGDGGAAGAAAAGAIGGTGGVGGGAGVGGSGGGVEEMCDLPEPNPEFLCDPTGDAPCQNCHDCQQIESGAAKTAAKECGTSCGTDSACATACVKDRVGATDACTTCLTDFYDCLIATCLVECLAGSDPCSSCSRTKKDSAGATCTDKWFACSGTEINPNF